MNTEPLVALAARFPTFVADRLNNCCYQCFERNVQWRVETGKGELCVGIVTTNPDAIRPVLPRLVTYCSADDENVRQGAAWTFSEVILAVPSLGPPILSGLLDRPAGTAPIRSGISRTVETLVSVAPDVAASAVEPLVETLGMVVEGREVERHNDNVTRTAHVCAARALAALVEAHPETVPDWTTAFIEPWRTGAFAIGDSGLSATEATNPLFVLAASAPAVAEEQFASLFVTIEDDSPDGDPAGLRSELHTADSELALAVADVLVELFDHEDPTVRRRELQEAHLVARKTSELGERLSKPLATQLSGVKKQRASEILESFRYIIKRNNQQQSNLHCQNYSSSHSGAATTTTLSL